MSKKLSKYSISYKVLALMLIFIAVSISEAFAQNYTFSLYPRRGYDKIFVEIWAKAANNNVPKLGHASLVVQYNTTFLFPSAVQNLSTTDSIRTLEVSTSQAIVNIISQFNAQNGYNALASQSYTLGYYSLELTLDRLGFGGRVPSTDGRGSFVGKLSFDIIGNPTNAVLANIQWSRSILPGDIRIFDINGTDIETQVTLEDAPQNFTVTGITILSPNRQGMVVDRDGQYLVLTNEYSDRGYPIYFERSVNPLIYSIPVGNPPAMDEDLAYVFDYSLDNGTNWTEIGRVTETDRVGTQVGNNPQYRTGEIFSPTVVGNYIITSQNGTQLTQNNFRQPVRVIWRKNPFFVARSEQARLRVTQLAGNFGSALTARANGDLFDINDFSFILGRLFFAQLNGINQYFKTDANYSNSTQVTVEAWINLNAKQPDGSQPAIVALSGGPGAMPVFNSNEGAWILYLKDGNRPAFRVREILARGTAPNNIYMGEVSSASYPVPVESAIAPLSGAHSKNWTYIAATVKDNVISLYVNGELTDRMTNTNANDIRMMTTSQPIWIGVNPNGAIAANNYLNAGLKSVRVWRVALEQEDIRRLASGIVSPSSIGQTNDIKKGLEILYSFEGTSTDLANEQYFQNGFNIVNYHTNGQVNNNAILYRPDKPHLKITTPAAKSGLLNKTGETTEIRWIGYGLGDIANLNSRDVELEYSIDNGVTWHFVKNSANQTLTASNAPDLEATKASWTPFLNNDAAANLRTINPYSRNTLLRIRGTVANAQSELNDISGPFRVAPYFAMRALEGSKMFVKGDEAMNISGNAAFFEAWIRPYRFPTDAEGYFPILEKTNGTPAGTHYNFRLLPSGQIQFNLTLSDGTVRTATSNPAKPLVRPNSIDSDSAWTHIAVLFVRSGENGQAEVRFYHDGIVQTGNELAVQIGDAIALNSSNSFPLYIASTHAGNPTFVGEIKEVRLWRGVPNNYSIGGSEPTQLTVFVQSAQAVLASNLPANLKTNLAATYSFNGGMINPWNQTVTYSNSSAPHIFNINGLEYVEAKPFIKLVEPEFRQAIENSNANVRVRWVGNYYDGQSFFQGAPTVPPSLEFSIRGGGGNVVQPYQYVGSRYWQGNLADAIRLPNDDRFRFTGTGSNIYYALSLNAAIADPDENNDGVYNDQGPLSATLTNARLRLRGRYQINGESGNLITESNLFTITPSSNFTVRVLLEGYHRGGGNGVTVNNLGSTFDRSGLRISLFANNANEIGPQIGPISESRFGYAERDPMNRNGVGNSRFANVNFVFSDLPDGNYWVLVEHINHLPIMSRFPAPFRFTGDLQSTWAIESGWDFLSWNGVENNVLTNPTANPWQGGLYTARGNATNNRINPNYSTTGLIYNGGQIGSVNPLAAMVGGDVLRDGQINAADRVLVRQDDGTSSTRSDVTGDGFVNALDRTITDRNFGKVSSIFNETLGNLIQIAEDRFNPNMLLDPFNTISEINPEHSGFFNDNARKIFNGEFIPIKKTADKTQSTLNYRVTAETSYNKHYVDVAMYIQNLAGDFGLANCTFAINYNSSTLDFHSLLGKDSVIFSNKPEVGYSELRTAPTPSAVNPLPEVRTIEVDYDAFANLGGVRVPNAKTYLGTLRFRIKDSKGVVSFAWHDSKVVITTDARDATPFGQFVTIPSFLLYTAQLTSPIGGEKYSQNKKQTIRWTSDGTSPVFIEFSSNSGAEWSRLNTDPISAAKKELEWTTPAIVSNFCLIRLIDAATGIELSRSASNFSIVPDFAQLIRPATSDAVYQGGANDKIRWTAIGPECVRFEFSSDGGAIWKPAVTNTAANLTEVNWKIPSVTTKTAVVRIIDCVSNIELVRSGFFKILWGNLTLSAPRSGETLIANKYYKIAWTYSNLTEFDMQVSTNGGATWTNIERNVRAINRSHTWLIPETPSENAIIRGVWNGDNDMEYGRTGTFRIIVFTTIDEFEIPTISNIYPNPANNIAFININTGHNEQIEVEIIDVFGNIALSKTDQLELGDNNIKINLSRLSQGKYLLVIKSNRFKAVKDLMIVK